MSKLNSVNNFKVGEWVLVFTGERGTTPEIRKVASIDYGTQKLNLLYGNWATGISPEYCHKLPRTAIALIKVKS